MELRALRLWTLVLLAINNIVLAAPVWPQPFDELEDIMFLNHGYRARGFSNFVEPCGSSPEALGRNAAAEWIRSAFHDAATGNAVGASKGVGGMDASLIFELFGIDGADNVGPGFNSTIVHMAPFFSTRSSMADLLSLGVYTAVRACGGPVIPIRTGRKDATKKGPTGVPQPQNSLLTFRNQFARMGFDNDAEMIQLVACGHTMGGVHSADFPIIVPAGTVANGVASFDTSANAFDNRVVNEYIGGNSTNPLLAGRCNSSGRCSDRTVYAADSNTTMRSLTNSSTYNTACVKVLQKMIELVPTGVSLSDPISIYEVKPIDLRLSLMSGGTLLSFSGEIRVQTTTHTDVTGVRLLYQPRDGSSCDSCIINASLKGSATGFDDTFVFYGFSAQIPAGLSISSFTVSVLYSDGGNHIHNNMGSGYPVDDLVLFQDPQSCIDSTPDVNGTLAVNLTAAVRGNASSASTLVNFTIPVSRSPVPVPLLTFVALNMNKTSTIGPYDIFTASYRVPAAQRDNIKFDIKSGSSSRLFQGLSSLPSVCGSLNQSQSSANSSTIQPSATLSTVTTASATASITSPSSTSDGYLGCYVDAPGNRALTGPYEANQNQTIERCASTCKQYRYFGLEYGVECFCGQTNTAVAAPDSDCNMPCGGDSAEKCGAGSRLSLYRNAGYQPLTPAKIPGYVYGGCYVDPLTPRALSKSSTSAASMTAETCAAFCNGASYFGLEYSTECYCGESLDAQSTMKPDDDCLVACGGNATQPCGAASRLTVYHRPTTSRGYSYYGCHVDSVQARVLQDKYTGSNSMTNEMCEDFCLGYTYYGTEYSQECFCGNSFINSSPLSAEADCNMACAGNSTEMCGGTNRLTIFRNATAAVAPPPTNPAIDSFHYLGCYTDSVQARTLDGGVNYDSSGMTVGKCANVCATYQYFGLEYSGECYCGNTFANPTTQVQESDCSMACSGNSGQLCGAGNRLSLYQKNAT